MRDLPTLRVTERRYEIRSKSVTVRSRLHGSRKLKETGCARSACFGAETTRSRESMDQVANVPNGSFSTETASYAACSTSALVRKRPLIVKIRPVEMCQ